MKLYVNIGDVVYGQTGDKALVILGSCVSIIMYVPHLQIGTLCHAQMPGTIFPDPELDLSHSTDNYLSHDAKTVTAAFGHMLYFFKKKGIEKKHIQVKLFGGGSKHQIHHAGKTIGLRNVEKAKEILNISGYNIMYEHTLGEFSRRIFFNFETGEIQMRQLFA